MFHFKRKVLLSPQKKEPPSYFVRIKSRQGVELKLADPRITRLALALMGMQAKLGGAASHWGGPSAFSEIVSALYGLVFHYANQENRPWYDLFHIINDVGHAENGIYALKANYNMGLSFSDLKGFRSIKSTLTGHGEAHLFPEGVYLSNGPLGSTLAQAQGLSMADRLMGLKRSTIVLMSDGASMEGEAKEAFSSIPGFFHKMNPFILILSDNNTKLSGRIDKDSFSLNPFFKSLKPLGWEYREVSAGHNLKTLVDILEDILLNFSLSSATDFLKENQKPVFIRVKTIKGYGVKETEEAEHGGHGFPLKDTNSLKEFLEEIYGGEDIPDYFIKWAKDLKLSEQNKKKFKPVNDNSSEKLFKSYLLSKELSNQELSNLARDFKPHFLKPVKVQEGISNALIYAREKLNFPVISISSDLQGSTGVLPFRKKFPEFSFDVGLAEANMISLAGGFSKQGFFPVVDTFSQFGVTKGALPLFMANLSLAPLIAVFSHAGLQDAADGASHQCLTYLSQTSSLPMTDVYSLSSKAEAFSLMVQAFKSFAFAYQNAKTPRTKIFFLGRETFAPSYLPEDYVYKLGKAQVIYSELNNLGKGVTLLAMGPLLEQALKAGLKLKEKGFKVIVLNASIINQPDINTLVDCLQKTDFRLLSIEDHFLKGGMGSLVSYELVLRGIKADILSLGVKSPFGRSAYKSDELYKREKLMAEDIFSAVISKWV